MLTFSVESARPVTHAASPLVALALRGRSEQPVQALLLRCQIRIDAAARPYAPSERESLRDLFGDPERPVRGLLWHNATIAIPGFVEETSFEIELPVSYDFTLATSKYLGALEGGDVPVTLLFSGSIFHGAEAMRVLPVPWSCEARFRLPVAACREALARHYPGGAPLALKPEVVERLERYRAERGLATWDATVESLLEEATR